MTAEVHRELVYSTIPGFRPLELDLYVGPQPKALCVWLHGGGWRVGSRRNGPGPPGTGTRFLHRIAERGLAVASVEYRLSGEARFPAQLDDVVAACDYLEQVGGDYGIGGLPFTLWGTSAGGHLVGLCALATPVGERVAAVASWSAPVDLLAMPADCEAAGLESDVGDESREAMFLGTTAADDPDLARRASPVAHAHPTTTAFKLVHGSADRNIPFAQTERYAVALAASGVEVKVEVVDGADHFYGSISDDELTRVVDDTADFLIGRAT